MVLELIMESLFAVVNVFWVSQLSREAVAVVGLTESVMTLIYAIAVGLSIAATAFVARRIGENDNERAAAGAGQVVLLGMLASAVLGLIFGYFADDILWLMSADPVIVAVGSDFARIMFGGNATVSLIFIVNAIFRGAGDPVLAMRGLWLANGLNILLGPCLIFGPLIFPQLGLTGAAIATNIGRGCGLLYLVWHLVGRGSCVRLRPRHLRFVGHDFKAIVETAAIGMAQLLIATTSWIGLYKILAHFGSSALAGYTIAVRVVTFVLIPASGLANAAATLVGQNLGAHKPERAEASVRIAARLNVIFLSLVGVLFIVFSHTIVSIFASDAEVIAHGTRALWILSLALPLYAVSVCMGAAFNGAGDAWTPARLNLCCFWAGQVPLAWLLSHTMKLGPDGVFAAVAISFSALALWSSALFKKGTWMDRRL